MRASSTTPSFHHYLTTLATTGAHPLTSIFSYYLALLPISSTFTDISITKSCQKGTRAPAHARPSRGADPSPRELLANIQNLHGELLTAARLQLPALYDYRHNTGLPLAPDTRSELLLLRLYDDLRALKKRSTTFKDLQN